MPKQRKYTDNEFITAVKSSFSVAGVLKKLGLNHTGGNYQTFHQNIERLGLNTSHFTGQGHLKGKKCPWSSKKDLSEILVENSTYLSTSHLKRRLIKEGILEELCSCCRINRWLGKKLVLHLDHINGIRTDNRIENLRLLCPNCHSQTSTFAGRNIGIKAKYRKDSSITSTNMPWKFQKNKSCIDCNKSIYHRSTRCKSCSRKGQQFKIKWPSTQKLINMIEKTSYLAVGRLLGVSDTAVRKHIRNHQ